MSPLKFVGELPQDGRAKKQRARYLDELRSAPGQWAEIARYPKARRASASSRGHQITRRNPDIEYTTRVVGDEAVLYMRAVSA
jgi:hypothetical protein